MKYGVYQFNTDYAMRADELGREVEARGFESLFVPEHSHIPASRKSPWPGGPNLPREYWRTLDPFVSLTAAAAPRATKGSSVCQYSRGSSLPPGHGLLRLAGMWVCSGSQSDSKPRDSSSRARASAGMA